MHGEVHHVAVALGDPGADNKQLFVLKAPTADNGGGIRLLGGWAHVATSVANSLGVGGTTFTLALHKYSTAGTPVVNGTISTNTLGGTAVGWTAGVTQTFTLNSAYSYISAGEWVVVQYNEVNAGNPTGGFVVLEYQMGK